MKIERKFSSKKDFDNFKDFVKKTLTSKGIKERDIDHYYSVVDRVGKKDLEVFMLLTSLLFNTDGDLEEDTK